MQRLDTVRTLGVCRRPDRKGGVNIGGEPVRVASRRSPRRVIGDELNAVTRPGDSVSPIDAAFVLPIGFFGMLLIGVGAVAADGRLGRSGVLALTCVLVAVTAAIAEPLAAAPLAMIGWFTVAGFSGPPYGELHLHGTGLPAVVLPVVAGGAAGAGWVTRRSDRAHVQHVVLPVDRAVTLDAVTRDRSSLVAAGAALRAGVARALTAARPAVPRPPGLSRARLLAGLAMAAILLPALTLVLTTARSHLGLVDDLLLYLLVVIVVTLIGGFWPAVLAAVTAGLLLNWFFTPPVHTWTIEAPQNMFALLLFVTSAVTVSSVVHLAARRDAIATQRSAEAATLLALARTVLAGDDTPQAVLDHLTETLGVTAELQERSGGRWIRVAGATGDADTHPIPAGTDLRLLVYGDLSSVSSHGSRRLRRADGRGVRAAAAADPGWSGRGAGCRQPDAHRAAGCGQPRPAQPTGLGEGGRRQLAPDRRAVDR